MLPTREVVNTVMRHRLDDEGHSAELEGWYTDLYDHVLRASEWTIRRGLPLALANKESLVMAGSYLVPLARETGATILPVDSEHCAIHQCLRGERLDRVRRIYLTASGGPFRERPLETIVGTLSPAGESGSLADVPLPVRAMAWMFVRSSNARLFKSAAMRALRIGG